jgi:hypothetical protein
MLSKHVRLHVEFSSEIEGEGGPGEETRRHELGVSYTADKTAASDMRRDLGASFAEIGDVDVLCHEIVVHKRFRGFSFGFGLQGARSIRSWQAGRLLSTMADFSRLKYFYKQSMAPLPLSF